MHKYVFFIEAIAVCSIFSQVCLAFEERKLIWEDIKIVTIELVL